MQKEVRKLIYSSKRLKLLTFYMMATGFAPWYAIERLFQSETLHLSPAQVVWTINVALASGLLLEIPSSILADRWSRSKVLGFSLFFAAMAGLIGGVSQVFWHYLIASFCWATASALFSGTADALTYDLLAEKNKTHLYAKMTAYFMQVFALSQIIASTLGGLLSQYYGYRYAYLAVLFVMPIGALLIYKMPEPQFHKKGQAATNLKHVGRAMHRIITKRATLLLAAMLVVTNYIIVAPMFEFSTYIMRSKGFGLATLGVVRALIINGLVLLLSGVIAAYYPKARRLIVPALFMCGISVMYATRPESGKMVFAVFFALAFILQRAASNWLQAALQHHFASAERATTSSIISWAGGLAWIAVSPFVVSRLTHSGASSVYVLTGVISIITAVLLGFCLFVLLRKTNVFTSSKDDALNVEVLLTEQKA